MNNSLTILVVEDEKLLLEAIKKKLSFLNISCISASSVAEAKQFIDTTSSPPDAIWLDFLLGDGSGLDVLEYVKSHPVMSTVPIFVVSNSGSDDKITQMLALGAARYMVKAEHRIEDIINIVKEFIEVKKEGLTNA